MDRGGGKTTNQIANAPQGAIFIWDSQHTYYPKNLAREMGRDDLRIVPPSWIETDAFRSVRLTGVVVDHAANLNDRQREILDIVITRRVGT